MDATSYLKMYKSTPVELAKTIIKDVLKNYGIVLPFSLFVQNS